MHDFCGSQPEQALDVSLAEQDHSRSFYTHAAYPMRENIVRCTKSALKWPNIFLICSPRILVRKAGQTLHYAVSCVLKAINSLCMKFSTCMYAFLVRDGMGNWTMKPTA